MKSNGEHSQKFLSDGDEVSLDEMNLIDIGLELEIPDKCPFFQGSMIGKFS